METWAIDLIWFFAITGVSIIVLYKFSDIIKERFKQRGLSKRAGVKEADVSQQFNAMLNNSPELLKSVSAEIENLRANGTSEEALKSLTTKQSLLKFAVENREIVDMIGKPIVGKLLGWVKGL